MTNSYITIQDLSETELIIKKSRFIASCAPCRDEQEAIGFIRTIRETHRSASHYCYAYIIGANMGIMRYNDDGEPGGTAGLPIMNALRSRQVVDCCIVVTRYFGGILLGTGGLSRAYAQSAESVLNKAEPVLMLSAQKFGISLSYSSWKALQRSIPNMPVQIRNICYQEDVSFEVYIPSDEADQQILKISDLCKGQIRICRHPEEFIAWTSGRHPVQIG